jgi:hypothetical protein
MPLIVMRKIITTMKYIMFCLSLVILIPACNNVKSTTKVSQLSVNAEILLAGDYIGRPFDTIVISYTSVLQISIKNTTSSPVSFWMMNCTWHDSFIFDTDNIGFCGTSCSRNFPEEFTLRPHDSIVFTSLIQQRKPIDRSISFKVGFVNFSEDDLMNLPNRSDNNYQSTNLIYWSNPVTPKYNRASYRY